ncbi:MAG: hypothetical protein ACP5VP_11755 [Candidatus Limnocylindrales bacterium]
MQRHHLRPIHVDLGEQLVDRLRAQLAGHRRVGPQVAEAIEQRAGAAEASLVRWAGWPW